MTEREADHVTVAVETAWGPNRGTHYEVWKVSHPLEQGEQEHERVRRFGATYDPADYAGVECCDPEDAPPTAQTDTATIPATREGLKRVLPRHL